jgi:hypothetical protein
MALQAGSAQTSRQMFNANLGSLAGIFWGIVANEGVQTAKTFQFQGNEFDASRYEIYLDNQLLFQSANQLNGPAIIVRQLQEALSSTMGDYCVSPFIIGRGTAATNRGTWYADAALWGLSTKLFASNSVSFDGTPVGTLTANFLINSSVSAGTSVYFYLVYDYIYMVDASGTVSRMA